MSLRVRLLLNWSCVVEFQPFLNLRDVEFHGLRRQLKQLRSFTTDLRRIESLPSVLRRVKAELGWHELSRGRHV
jgi:hypothetical protein